MDRIGQRCRLPLNCARPRLDNDMHASQRSMATSGMPRDAPDVHRGRALRDLCLGLFRALLAGGTGDRRTSSVSVRGQYDLLADRVVCQFERSDDAVYPGNGRMVLLPGQRQSDSVERAIRLLGGNANGPSDSCSSTSAGACSVARRVTGKWDADPMASGTPLNAAGTGQ